METTLVHPGKKSKAYSEIQITLQAFFPNTHFKMNFFNEENDQVIRIGYEDGASLTRVKNAVRHFNRPANPSIRFPGIKVEVKRAMKARTKNLLLGEIKTIFNLKTVPSETDWVSQVNSSAGDYIHKIFAMRDFE